MPGDDVSGASLAVSVPGLILAAVVFVVGSIVVSVMFWRERAIAPRPRVLRFPGVRARQTEQRYRREVKWSLRIITAIVLAVGGIILAHWLGGSHEERHVYVHGYYTVEP
jgi:hypothetical protein